MIIHLGDLEVDLGEKERKPGSKRKIDARFRATELEFRPSGNRNALQVRVAVAALLLCCGPAVDPDAPAAITTVDTPGSAAAPLAPGQFPDPNWTFPAEINDVPVQRQRPEEEGHIPPWASQ